MQRGLSLRDRGAMSRSKILYDHRLHAIIYDQTRGLLAVPQGERRRSTI